MDRRVHYGHSTVPTIQVTAAGSLVHGRQWVCSPAPATAVEAAAIGGRAMQPGRPRYRFGPACTRPSESRPHRGWRSESGMCARASNGLVAAMPTDVRHAAGKSTAAGARNRIRNGTTCSTTDTSAGRPMPASNAASFPPVAMAEWQVHEVRSENRRNTRPAEPKLRSTAAHVLPIRLGLVDPSRADSWWSPRSSMIEATDRSSFGCL
jgi:hypothetical protein